jgi:para-nitrobenzyl esterase
MVWIHGGGFVNGSGAFYDATRLAVRGDVVAVTVNYRLGVFGFLSHRDLPNSGNFGLQDQQAALRWVRRNVGAFGGDPRNVTVFGESAGAMSTCAQLTSPSAKGLFHRAIVQSGPCTMSWPANALFMGGPAGTPFLPRAEANAEGLAMAKRLGCADGANAAVCLRAKPVADLLSQEVAVAPVYGTAFLPVNPPRAIARGLFHRVPVISGTTRDENTLFVAMAQQPISVTQYHQLVRKAFGEQAAKVEAKYPLAAYASPSLAWATLTTDRVWACPSLDTNRLFARRVPTYSYEFADRAAPPIFPFPDWIPAGASHGSELMYLFTLVGFEPPFTPGQRKLSDQMIRYWARFAAAGNPNGKGPRWPGFAAPSQTVPYVQSLAPGPGGIRPVDIAVEHHCGFWSTLGR